MILMVVFDRNGKNKSEVQRLYDRLDLLFANLRIRKVGKGKYGDDGEAERKERILMAIEMLCSESWFMENVVALQWLNEETMETEAVSVEMWRKNEVTI